MNYTDLCLSRFVRLLICAGCIAVVAGCLPGGGETESTLSGQVFVIMPTGESLLLGAVQVRVFGEEQIRSHFESREKLLAAHHQAQREKLAELEVMLAGQREALASAERAYYRRVIEVRAEMENVVEKIARRAAAIQGQIAANDAFIASRDALPPQPEGIPSRQESEEYEKRRAKWLSMNREERLAWADALAGMNVRLEEEIEDLEITGQEKIIEFGDEIQALDIAMQEAEEIAGATQAAMETIAAKLKQPFAPGDYLSDMPAPLRQVLTDAHGGFQVNVPAGQRYVVLAETKRSLGGEKVELTWFLKTEKQPAPRLIMSSHNLITEEVPENIFTHMAKAIEPDA